MTAEEHDQINALLDDAEAIDGEIQDRQKNEAVSQRLTQAVSGLSQSNGPRTVQSTANRVQVTRDAADFACFGDFLQAVVRAGVAGGYVDQRLRGSQPNPSAGPSTYNNEAVGTDGGFLVPTDYAQKLYELSLEEDAILPRTDNNPLTGNSMEFPKDESTPWGTDGVQCYWDTEAQQMTQSKLAVNREAIRLNRMTCLVPVTDEQLADAPATERYLMNRISRAIRWKSNDSFINGNGVGKPLGILNAPCLVTVAKESGQAADTIVAANIVKMFARLPAESQSRAEFYCNNDVWEQLPLMTIGNQPMYFPAGGMGGLPYATLLGRPVHTTQSCRTLGDVGDIVLADFSQYLTVTKRSGVETASSIHLWFDFGVTAFRAMYRLNGRPWLTAAVTPQYGSNSLSHYVALAARA